MAWRFLYGGVIGYRSLSWTYIYFIILDTVSFCWHLLIKQNSQFSPCHGTSRWSNIMLCTLHKLHQWSIDPRCSPLCLRRPIEYYQLFITLHWKHLQYIISSYGWHFEYTYPSIWFTDRLIVTINNFLFIGLVEFKNVIIV